jgi:hypothetical protein
VTRRALAARLAAAAAAAAVSAPLAVAAPASLCDAGETAYFGCAVANGKTLAVCGALPERLQYRFGRPGAIELAHPAAANDGPRTLLIAHYHRYRTNRLTLRFERAGVSYMVFDEHEDGRGRAGVQVKTADARAHELVCAGPVASRLSELVGVVACDHESALSGGRCP